MVLYVVSLFFSFSFFFFLRRILFSLLSMVPCSWCSAYGGVGYSTDCVLPQPGPCFLHRSHLKLVNLRRHPCRVSCVCTESRRSSTKRFFWVKWFYADSNGKKNIFPLLGSVDSKTPSHQLATLARHSNTSQVAYFYCWNQNHGHFSRQWCQGLTLPKCRVGHRSHHSESLSLAE